MTIGEVGREFSDLSIKSEDRLSLSNLPFSSWVILNLATSRLYPREYQSRSIEDKGSIAESLTAAQVSVLDPIASEQYFLIKMFRKVTLFAAGFFTIVPAAFLGVGYHGLGLAKHLFLVLTDGQNASHHWEKVHRHKNCLPRDLLVLVLPPVIAASELTSFSSPVALVISFVIDAGFFATIPFQPSNWWFPGDHNFFLQKNEAYAFQKSLILWKEFGLESSSDGGLLNWDAKKDTDLGFDLMFDQILRGYFGRLYQKEGQALFGAVKQLQQTLPKDCKMSRSISWWDVGSIGKFLKKNQARTGLSILEVENWEQNLFTLERKMRLAEGIIKDAYKRALSLKYVSIPSAVSDTRSLYAPNAKS